MQVATRYRNLPIKHKLRLIVMFTTTVALMLACSAVLTYDRIQYRVALQNDCETLAEILGLNSTAALTFSDRRAADELLAGLRARRNITVAVIFSADGQPFGSYQRDGKAPLVPLPRRDGSWFESDKLAVYKAVVLDGQKIGAVYLESDLEALHARLLRFAWIVVIILVAASTLVLALSSRLQRVVSEPIAHLAQIAKTISVEKNYAVRGIKHADDELGQLIDTFNEMLTEIELNRHRLEGQVSARTVELVAARDKAEAASRALRTSEERFRIAAESASDLVYEWDLRTGELIMSGASADRFGDWPTPRSIEEWKSTIHPEDIGVVLTEIAHHIENGTPYSGEYRVLGQDGRTYYYFSRGQIIQNPTGESYRWVGVATDITEQKTAEAAISQLAAIVQCSEDAIIATDLSGRITTWNGGAERLLGYAPAEALGEPLSMLFPRPEEVPAILRPCARGSVSRLDETVYIRKDGAEVPVSLTISPMRKTSGQINGLAAIARDISARKKAETELAHQAQHDHLTGLPNRLLLADRLAASIECAGRSGLMTAVIYVDLDGFKFVNDTLGHEVGDALLRHVTDRLATCVREPDTLARMGGDEFMLVVNEVGADDVALSIAERLRTALRRHFTVDSHDLYMTASIGIAMYPRDGEDVNTLRRNADAAMYEAKHEGKDRVLFFTPAMRDSFLERLELETELRRALDRNELTLHYQPIFEAKTGRQTAFEALLRWFHPTLGNISPAKFIPVAEENGLIIRLGAWVLKEACRQCRQWQDHGFASVRVAVNASALEFARGEFVDNVVRVLGETGLPGNLLDLEVTETMLMRDMDGAIAKMSLLHQRGIRISIDDFGTGYSSLGYLPRLPVDTLKIDRSFVANLGTNPTALSLIKGMISLAHSIGKRVVVEGVETPEQLEILTRAGCDEIQGFLLGRPAALPNWDEPGPVIITEAPSETGTPSELVHI